MEINASINTRSLALWQFEMSHRPSLIPVADAPTTTRLPQDWGERMRERQTRYFRGIPGKVAFYPPSLCLTFQPVDWVVWRKLRARPGLRGQSWGSFNKTA
jgi:hypothetical protein